MGAETFELGRCFLWLSGGSGKVPDVWVCGEDAELEVFN